MIEGELRSETIEKFAKLGLYNIPKDIVLPVIDMIDLADIHPTVNVLIGDYIDNLLTYLIHLDGKNRDDIIRILHGHKPVERPTHVLPTYTQDQIDSKPKKRGLRLW